MATIVKRGKDTYLIRIAAGYDDNGKQIKINRTFKANPNSTEKSQLKQAQQYAAQLETDYRRKLITEAKKVRFSQVAEDYLKFKEMAESTKKWYKDLLDGRILPAIGNIFVQDLTPRQLKVFFKDLAEAKAKPARTNKKKETEKKEGSEIASKVKKEEKKTPKTRSKTGKLSGAYRHQYYKVLSAILNYAIKSGYITVSPLTAVDPPRVDTTEAEFFEGKEVADLVNALEKLNNPMWKAYFLLELYTSARPGELVGLNWSDLKDKELHIQAGAYNIKGKGTLRSERPKTKKSNRRLILPDEVVKVLGKWKSVQSEYRLKFNGKWPDSDAMFTTDLGRRVSVYTPTKKWRKIQKEYGLKDIRLYSFRHTGPSLLIAAGCDVKEVSSRLGHSRASTTLDIYTHIFEKAAQHSTDVMISEIQKIRDGANNQKKAE